MSSNQYFHRASHQQNDDFYTQLSDIENELRHYRHHFEGKIVYCNCDDPKNSNFYHYFSHSFEFLELKKLITTCYRNRQFDLFSTMTMKIQYGLNAQVWRTQTAVIFLQNQSSVI